MAFRVALNFEDGVTRFINCPATDTVADASYRAGINIPIDCRDGACGTCKVFCESGKYDGGSYIEDALTDEEAAKGFALTCQMRPKSDLVLRVPVPSSACKTGPVKQKAVMEVVNKLSPTTISFSLKLTDPVKFLPGQYVNIEVPGTGQHRAYSFSSAPGADTASFLIRNIPGGLMSTFIASQAKPGDEVNFVGPSGSFFLREIARPVLMLAGGTGLAPMLSMLAYMEANPPAQKVHLVYGVTNDEDLVETAALDEFAAKIPGFTWEACIANPASAYPRKGYVTQHLLPEHINGGDVDVYLCGPPAMVEAVRKYFTDTGVTPVSFHYEKFNPSSPSDKAA